MMMNEGECFAPFLSEEKQQQADGLLLFFFPSFLLAIFRFRL